MFVLDNQVLQGRAISAMADIDYQMYSLLNQIPAAIKDARYASEIYSYFLKDIVHIIIISSPISMLTEKHKPQ